MLRGSQFNPQEVGAGVFFAGKIFISTRLGEALKNLNFNTFLYNTVLEVNYYLTQFSRIYSLF